MSASTTAGVLAMHCSPSRLVNATADCQQLYRKYHAGLVRFLTRLTHCSQRAEDLAQAAWLKLLAAKTAGTCPATDEVAARAYLFAMGRNAFLDEYTRKHESIRTRTLTPAEFETLTCADGPPGPEQSVEREQVRRLVQRAVTTLPYEQREVIDMWCRGTSIRDMARRTTAPVDTVLSRKKYALSKLRRELENLREQSARAQPSVTHCSC